MLGFHPVGTSLVKLVPAHHVYLRLLQRVDFSFVRPLVAPFYSAIGRPSLDPVVFVKLLIVQHLENITSDRKLVELASLHVGIRAFLGYDLAQLLPSHSTVSRTRQRLPVAVFEACFTQVVGLCVQQGLVSGHTQVVDSAYIKANASMSGLKPKQALWLAEGALPPATAGTTRLLASAARLQQLRRLQTTILQAAPTKPGRLFSNFTHYSPADPEARIAYKTGKPRQLAYRASVSVDAAQHVITHIYADLADERDSRYLLPLVDATQQRLQRFGLVVHQVVADAGYSSGENYAQLKSWHLLGFIPPHGKYKAQRPGFTYEAASDSYVCSQGKRLPFERQIVDRQGNVKNRYMAKPADCRHCPIKVQCKGKSPQEKRLHDTAYKAYYERMLTRLATRAGKRMLRLRASTGEPVLGSLITYYGLRQISKKRQAGAAKVMYLAAMAYNLIKYLRASAPQQPASAAIALPLPGHLFWCSVPFCNSHCNYKTAQTSCCRSCLTLFNAISYICNGRGASPCPQKERQLAFELAACSFFQAVYKGVVAQLVGREIDGLPIRQHEVHLLDAFRTPGLKGGFQAVNYIRDFIGSIQVNQHVLATLGGGLLNRILHSVLPARGVWRFKFPDGIVSGSIRVAGARSAIDRQEPHALPLIG
jgi:transposase